MYFGLLSLFIGQILGNTVVPIGTKISTSFTDPLLFVLFRFIISTAALFVLLMLSERKKIKGKEYRDFAFLGALLTINVICFTIGIGYTTVIMSSLIYSVTPILVGVAGHFFLDERLDKQKILGLCVAFIGLLFLVAQSITEHEQNAFGHPIGNFLICIAMVGYSFYVFQSRVVLHKKENYPIQTTFWTFVFVTLIVFFLSVLGFLTGNIHIQSVPFAGVFGFLIVGMGSVAQYLCLQIGVKQTSAFTASLFQYVAPFITAAATIPLLHEKITVQLIIGGLLILLGVFIATTYNQFRKKVTYE